MRNKLHLIRKTVRLTCTWVRTGDPKGPLACVWGMTRTPQAAHPASSTNETGRIHLWA